MLAFAFAQLGAVDQRITLALALAHRFAGFTMLGDRDRDFAMTRHYDHAVAAVDRVDVVQAQDTFVAHFERGLLGAPARGATDMEGAHRQLRARLADRLRCHRTDRFAHVDQMTAAEVASVTAYAHPLA